MDLVSVHLIQTLRSISKVLLFHNLLRLLAKCRASFYSIDHNIQTVDGLNIFHCMGIIKAATPGIKCTLRIILCVEVTAEDVAVAKVGIHFY